LQKARNEVSAGFWFLKIYYSFFVGYEVLKNFDRKVGKGRTIKNEVP